VFLGSAHDLCEPFLIFGAIQHLTASLTHYFLAGLIFSF
jgi:hypothetical protein